MDVAEPSPERALIDAFYIVRSTEPFLRLTACSQPMGDPEAAAQFFQKKASEWIETAGSVEGYIKAKGKEGLIVEFRGDPDFTPVCELVHDIGELKLRSHVLDSIGDSVNEKFGSYTTGELNVVMGAIGTVCGFTTVGQKLVVAGVAAAVAAGIIGALIARSRLKKPEPQKAK